MIIAFYFCSFDLEVFLVLLIVLSHLTVHGRQVGIVLWVGERCEVSKTKKVGFSPLLFFIIILQTIFLHNVLFSLVLLLLLDFYFDLITLHLNFFHSFSFTFTSPIFLLLFLLFQAVLLLSNHCTQLFCCQLHMLWVWLGHTPADPCEARDEVNPIALLQVHQPLHLKGL